jgi:D-citramalate synthase
VSEGEFQGVKGIMTWAKEKGYAHQIEVLTLLIMDSIEWMKKGRNCSKFINQRILNHLTHQLKKNT